MINTTIGKYKIIRLIGEGGMAAVYEAEHEMLGTNVAIKVLNPLLSYNTQIRERFKNEAKIMASLNHPNIARVLDFDEQPQQLSIVMDFLDGEDLNQKIKTHGPLSDKEIEAVFSQTLSAFQYAHEKGIVHRDIKPSNIFILPDGQAKILDFGIAKLYGQGNEMTQTGTQLGTPIYMSPEQVKADKTIDRRSDIYSLGVTMFFAINGKPPYNSETDSQFDIFTKIVYEGLPEFSKQSRFKEIVLKACHKNKEERFQNCTDFLTKMGSPAATESIYNDKTIIETPTTEGIFSKTNNKVNQLEKAIELLKTENHEEAFNILNSSILEGNSDAQYYLAKMFQQGNYIEVNPEKAFELAKKSAEQGNDKGLNFLGMCYNEGLGTYKNSMKALEYYTQSATLGNAKAYNNLGNLYLFGNDGINIDYAKAKEYFLKCMTLATDKIAAELEGKAEVSIGQIYLTGGHGVAIDYEKAKEYFLLAKDKKNALASERLGYMYEHGIGAEEDYYQAFQYYTFASDLNNSDAQLSLGKLYFYGDGCTENDFKALELFKKSADQKNATGLAYLGFMFELGRGGAEKNLNKARMYYSEAAELGDEFAKSQLEFL